MIRRNGTKQQENSGVVYTSITGMYTGDSSPEDQHLFVCEQVAFRALSKKLAEPCPRCRCTLAWSIESTTG